MEFKHSRGIAISPIIGIPIILLIFGAMAFVYWNGKQIDPSWVRTDAVVVEGKGKHRAAVVEFTDQESRELVRASASDFSFSSASRGDRVKIAYNPIDRTDVKITEKPGSELGSLLPVFLIGGVFATFGYVRRRMRS